MLWSNFTVNLYKFICIAKFALQFSPPASVKLAQKLKSYPSFSPCEALLKHKLSQASCARVGYLQQSNDGARLDITKITSRQMHFDRSCSVILRSRLGCYYYISCCSRCSSASELNYSNNEISPSGVHASNVARARQLVYSQGEYKPSFYPGETHGCRCCCFCYCALQIFHYNPGRCRTRHREANILRSGDINDFAWCASACLINIEWFLSNAWCSICFSLFDFV